MVTMLGCIFVKQNNMSKEQKITVTNISIPTTVFIVFLILKLTNNIDWSWWWVTSPLWAPTLGVLGLTLLSVILTKLTVFLEQNKK